jgi:hypothetical protein
MHERISWFVENRVIWLIPRENTTVDVLIADNAIIVDMIREAHAITGLPVHVIIDGNFMGKQPSPLEGRSLLTYITEPGMGYRVVAGTGNPQHHFFSTFVGTLKPGSTLVIPTLDRALSTLSLKDRSLPDLLSLYRARRNGKNAADVP